jgi:hypothetical protein
MTKKNCPKAVFQKQEQKTFLIIIVIVVKPVSIVVIVVVVRVIPFGIVNQAVTVSCQFEEKVAYPEVKVPVYINPFVIIWHLFEIESKWNVYKNISDSPLISEEMTIVAVITAMVMFENVYVSIKSADTVPVNRVMIVITMVFVRVRIVSSVVINPAVMVPAVTFPSVIPVIEREVIVMSVVVFTFNIVVVTFRSEAAAPGFGASAVFATRRISGIVIVVSVKAAGGFGGP